MLHTPSVSRPLPLLGIAIGAFVAALLVIAAAIIGNTYGQIPDLVLSLGATAFVLALPVVFVASGRIPFVAHLPLWLLYGEVLIYAFLAPDLALIQGGDSLAPLSPWYALLQWGIALLCCPALLLVYARLVRRHRLAASSPVLAVRPWPLLGLCSVALVGAPVYLYLLQSHGLLFRRLGFNGLVDAYAALPRPEFYAMRTFDRLFLPLGCLLLITARQRMTPPWRLLVWPATMLALGTAIAVAAINSRLDSALAVALIAVVGVYWWLPRPTLQPAVALRLAIAALGVLYLFHVASNVRADWGTIAYGMQDASPTYTAGVSPYGADTPLAQRLNCVDLLARMTPTALQTGYSAGASWAPSLIVTFGQLVDPRLADAYKQAIATTPKWYLMRQYTSLALPDYPSCALTDAYGNLGPPGLALAGAVLALLLSVVTRWLARPDRAWQVAVALIVLVEVLAFEQDFLGLALRPLQAAPALLILLALNPLRMPNVATIQ